MNNKNNRLKQITKNGLLSYTLSIPKIWLVIGLSILQHIITVGTPFFIIFMMSQLWFIDNPITYIQLCVGFIFLGGLWISTAFLRDQLFYNILLEYSIDMSSNTIQLMAELPYSYVGNLPVESQFTRLSPLENLSYTWLNGIVKPMLDLPLVVLAFSAICSILGFAYFAYILTILGLVIFISSNNSKSGNNEDILTESEFHGTIKDTLNNISLINAHKRADYFINKAHDMVVQKSTYSYIAETKNQITQTICETLLLLIYLGSLSFGVYYTLFGLIDIRYLVVILLLTWFSIAPFKVMLNTASEIPKAKSLLQQIMALQKISTPKNRHKKLILPDDYKGTILLRSVNLIQQNNSNFKLTNINFHVKRGEVLVLNGASGSGKSSILKLLTGLYKQTSGMIMLDYDINLIDEESLKDKIVFISNDAYFDSLSIYDNLQLAHHELSHDDIVKLTQELEINADADSNVLNNYPLRDFKAIHSNKISYQEIINKIVLSKIPQNISNKVILFDEPIFDGSVGQNIYFAKLIKSIKDNNTIIIASRNTTYNFLADYIVSLHNGKITKAIKQNG